MLSIGAVSGSIPLDASRSHARSLRPAFHNVSLGARTGPLVLIDREIVDQFAFRRSRRRCSIWTCRFCIASPSQTYKGAVADLGHFGTGLFPVSEWPI